MKGRARTTIVRILAVASLVIIARSVRGEREHRAAPTAPPPRQAVVVQERSVETAAAAAERILAAYATFPMMAAPEAETRLREIASNAAENRLVVELRADLTRLAAGYPGGQTRLWVGPLATRETVVDEHRRKVEVWFSRVVAPPGREVYVEWRLGRLDLVWERNGWRLDGLDESPGPRPAALPGRADSTVDILSALDGFAPVRI